MALEDLAEFEYAGLARHFAQKGEGEFAGYALTEQNKRLGHDDGTKALMGEFVYSNEKGVKKAIEVYGGNYMASYESADLGELIQYHERELDGLDEVKGELEKNSGKTIKDLKEKLDEVQYDLKGIQKGYSEASDEEKENLVKESQKDAKILSIVGTLQEAKFESMRSKIAKEYYAGELRKLAGNS